MPSVCKCQFIKILVETILDIILDGGASPGPQTNSPMCNPFELIH